MEKFPLPDFNNLSESNLQKPENARKLDNSRKVVEKLVDKLGKHVDDGIKETVAILRAMDFTTTSSCAGHKSEKEGFGLPYIEICTKPQKGWEEDKEKKMIWMEENIKQLEKIKPLLNEFNNIRNPSSDARLGLYAIGVFGAFRIENAGSKKITEFKSWDEAVEKVSAYQKEMTGFTEFLKEKFLK